jgi:small subunit ribosomal protein S20
LAHHASAQKAMRQSLKRRARNRKSVSRVKTEIKRLRTALATGDAKEATLVLPATLGAIDKAAKQGVIHTNAASRYKSRLTRRVNAVSAAPKA